ncbi:uncharacterized protein BDZ83DRAFT_600867 [Colletotrichum acutatum]|uniref:Secreted protein n=1 Tax=Glomerella acutata TaxID=27357 RepID=A0AAD9D2U6_GLOAC|nr:uncharacterized protein BDZ83DRAFT_600867 [Colletotrichum acutatum]KAK1730841.1 hypothetical protein BDZ83DRAFT_600867 [Colletotrichum acutatum]
MFSLFQACKLLLLLAISQTTVVFPRQLPTKHPFIPPIIDLLTQRPPLPPPPQYVYGKDICLMLSPRPMAWRVMTSFVWPRSHGSRVRVS